jgi:16S rRNA processing protein RimM
MVIAKIKGVDTPEQAQAMRGKVLYIDRDDADLPEGSYFVADLIGLEVRDEAGRVFGVITDVLQTGANDVYEIKNDNGKLYYIPAIPSVVLLTDIQGGIMTIYPMEGLFDED